MFVVIVASPKSQVPPHLPSSLNHQSESGDSESADSCQVSQRGDDYGDDLSVWSVLLWVLLGLGEGKSNGSGTMVQNKTLRNESSKETFSVNR